MSKLPDFLDENPDKLFDDDFLLGNFGYYPYADSIMNREYQLNDCENCGKEPSQTSSSSYDTFSATTASQGTLSSMATIFNHEEAATQTFTGERNTEPTPSSSSSAFSAEDFFDHFHSTHILDPTEMDDIMYTHDVIWGLGSYDDDEEEDNNIGEENSSFSFLPKGKSEDKNEEESQSEESDNDDEEEYSEESSGSDEDTPSSSAMSPDTDTEIIDISTIRIDEPATQPIHNAASDIGPQPLVEVRAPSIPNDSLYQISYPSCGTNTLDNIESDFVNRAEIRKVASPYKCSKKRKAKRKNTKELPALASTKTQNAGEDNFDDGNNNNGDNNHLNTDKKPAKKSQQPRQQTTKSKGGRKKKTKEEIKEEVRESGEKTSEHMQDDSEEGGAHNTTRKRPKNAKALCKKRLSAIIAEANAVSEKTRNKTNMEYTYVKPTVYTNAASNPAIEVDAFDEEEYNKYVKKLNDDVDANMGLISQGVFMHKGEPRAEAPVAVVESYSSNIARSIFVYPPRTHQNLEIQRPEKPIEDKFPVIKPAAVHVGDGTMDYLLASALIVRRLRSNRIVLHKIVHKKERCGNEWEVSGLGGGDSATGFTFKTRVADIKWLTTQVLAVANGDAIKAVSVRGAKPLPSVTAQRTSLNESACEWVSHNNSPELFSGGNIIRELDSKRSAPGLIFTGTENGSVMLYDIFTRDPIQRFIPTPETSSPISSVRGNGLAEFVYSFTTDSGSLCLCDRRMSWSRPAFRADTNVLVGDTFSSLWTHDWNPAVPGEVVLGYASKAVGSMAGLDIRFPACVLHAKDYRSSVLPFDMHFADGCSRTDMGDSVSKDWRSSNFAIFGERNFSISNLHSNFDWFTPAAEKEFNANQVCVMGCFLEQDTLLTVSDNADLKIWSILNM